MTISSSRVFIVDDEEIIRKALGRLLSSAQIPCTAYPSARDFLNSYDPDAPGCLLLDLLMPDINGLELQQTLAARGFSPPVLFLTGNAEVPDTVRAMKQGAAEFFTKPVDDEALLEAIRRVMEQDKRNRANRSELNVISARLATLTPRENEVLQHVVVGRLNKQTAAELGTTEKTIKVHRARVMGKMQVRSLAELVRLVGRLAVQSRH
jgi:FixJ family two-component response regulator